MKRSVSLCAFIFAAVVLSGEASIAQEAGQNVEEEAAQAPVEPVSDVNRIAELEAELAELQRQLTEADEASLAADLALASCEDSRNQFSDALAEQGGEVQECRNEQIEVQAELETCLAAAEQPGTAEACAAERDSFAADLETCETSVEQFTARLFEQSEILQMCRTDRDEHSANYDVCQQDLRVQRNTNIDLNRDLEACLARLPDVPINPDPADPVDPVPVPDPPEVVELRAQLEAALAQNDQLSDELTAAEERADRLQARNDELVADGDAMRGQIAALSDRLLQFGISLEPGFVYARSTSFDSFLRRDQILDLPRLAVNQCPDAIAWMQERLAGNDTSLQPLRLETWAWLGDTPIICEMGADGQVSTREPGLNSREQAHVVIFQ